MSKKNKNIENLSTVKELRDLLFRQSIIKKLNPGINNTFSAKSTKRLVAKIITKQHEEAKLKS
ncbi:MAG: hypothetical protein QM538_00280 [Methylacidiphilales bacterium]|nr:hypothetical protein [Candidatus Methylacidiphilales bacterium]